MKLPNSKARRRARIEIIPLIDIIFFLLATFVMVSLSMIKNSGVPVHLPTATTASAQQRDPSITLSITKDGAIYFEKSAVTLDELKTKLGILRSKEADPKIFIHSDEETAFKNVMAVMDTVRSLGIHKVILQTRPSPKGIPLPAQ